MKKRQRVSQLQGTCEKQIPPLRCGMTNNVWATFGAG
jgi:hypothetical protein